MSQQQVSTHVHNVTDIPVTAIANEFARGTVPFALGDDVPIFFGTTAQFQMKLNSLTNPDQLGIGGANVPADINGYAIAIATPDASSVTGARTSGGITLATGNSANAGNNSGASGGLNFTTGNSTNGSSGSITFQSGTANNTQSRGDLLLLTRGLQQPPIRTNGGLNMTLGAVPSLLVQDLADPASGDTTYAQVRAIRIARIYAIKDSNAGGAGDQIVIKNAAGSTISTLNLNVAANTVVTPSTLVTANGTIAAGANITFTTTKATNAGCTVFIEYVPTSEAG